MYFLVAIIVILILLLALGALYSVFSKKIEFYITGLDSKFTFSDLKLLWHVSQICDLEQPTSLFWSMQSLTRCMAHITSDAAQNNKENDEKTQKLISKLFDYRTKLQNETDSKKGLDSTLYLDKGQKLRIILPGQGVFTSKILNNGKEIIISVPRKKEMIPISAENWMGKVISVYLWRANDARYVFDTSVINHGLFIGEPSISIKHSNNLVRTQNRKTVRAKCNIPANLYILTQQHATNTSSVETQTGYKCILEDISESGALIHIAGKGQQNVQLKLQFNIQSILIIMVGVVRTVEYNPQLNESLLHFECTSIEPSMKNEILSFVYNMLPEREKEVYEAISMTSQDEKEDAEANKTSADEIAAENTSAATTEEYQPSTEQNTETTNTEDNTDTTEIKTEADIFSLDDVL